MTFLPALLLVVLLAACSDDTLSEAGLQQQQSDAIIRLTDAKGNDLQSLPGTHSLCYAIVRGKGEWELCADEDFLLPLKTQGKDTDTIPLIVGENWNAMRQTVLRAGPAKALVQQSATDDLEGVRESLTAVRGAGYTYRTNTNYCMGTGIEVFNLARIRQLQDRMNGVLGGPELISDDYHTSSNQRVTIAESVTELNKKLSVGLGIGIFVGLSGGDLSVNFDKRDYSMSSSIFTQYRLTQTYFSREINYLNLRQMVADSIAASKHADDYYNQTNQQLAESMPFFNEVYSAGFGHCMQELINKIHRYSNQSARYNACRDFVNAVGPTFVCQSQLGCTLDYYSVINRDSLSSSISVEASVDICIKAGLISAGADVTYDKDVQRSVRNSQSRSVARGGDLSLVTAFTTGQEATLDRMRLSQWQSSVIPYNAALIDIRICPIYDVIYDELTRSVMQDFFYYVLAPEQNWR